MRGFLGRAGFTGLGCLGVSHGLGPCVEQQPAVQPAPPIVTGVGPGIDELVEVIPLKLLEQLQCPIRPPAKVIAFTPLRRQAAFTFECKPVKRELLVAGEPNSSARLVGATVAALALGVVIGSWLKR